MIAAHPHEMRIIAVVSNKGGVGKSTTAFNVGAEAVLRGMRVLLVDADRQPTSPPTRARRSSPGRASTGCCATPRCRWTPVRSCGPGSPGRRGRSRPCRSLAPPLTSWRWMRSSARGSATVASICAARWTWSSRLRPGGRGSRSLHRADSQRARLRRRHRRPHPGELPRRAPCRRHAPRDRYGARPAGSPRIEAIRRTVVSAWRRQPNASGDAQVLSRLRDLYGDCLSPNIFPECSYVSEANASRLTLREFREQYPRTGSPLQALVDGYSALTNFVMARLPEDIPA